MIWAAFCTLFLFVLFASRINAAAVCYMNAKSWRKGTEMYRALTRSYYEHLITGALALALSIWGLTIIVRALLG